MAITTPPQSERAAIGWDGQTLHEMLTASEQRFAALVATTACRS
jgi:hypothetical protein